MESVISRASTHSCILLTPSITANLSATSSSSGGANSRIVCVRSGMTLSSFHGVQGRQCGGLLSRSSLFSGSELRSSPKFSSSVSAEAPTRKSLEVHAAVGTGNVVREPATSINFSTTLTVPDSSSELSFLGAGVREKQIAFLKVKVYAVGLYAEAGIASSLAPWKGKSAADLAKDDALYKELAEAPVEKALQIVLARDVDGATFWGALDEALVPRLKAVSAGADGDAALAALGKVFQSRSLKKGFVIILNWVQPSTLKIAVAESESAAPKTESSIESKPLLSALFDVFLGANAVSPSAKTAMADGITKLI